jgi:tRNA-2-methylthio-N6-dimethylallyladenosine synthase
MKYFIQVFGCAANVSDGERIAATYEAKGWKKAASLYDANDVIIISCSIRQSAEDRVMGLVRNLTKRKNSGKKIRIILTGCMVGMAVRDTSGKLLKQLQRRMPAIDEFLSIDEVGFTNGHVRGDKTHALVMISNGCNNFCSYCVVPYARGKEISRQYKDIISECTDLAKRGYTSITLVGQNVNSYGSDLKRDSKKPIFVKHLGKMRIPSLFPYLLGDIAQIQGLKAIDFISSNPWDFSDELIEVIKKNKNIKRLIHLPVQSGDEAVLKRMNRWYTPAEYIQLVGRIRKRILDVQFSTDIIVGFPGETKTQFAHTVSLCKKVGFMKAYVSIYSDRPQTVAHKQMPDDVPFQEKKRRWELLDELINKTNLRKGTYPLYE